MSDLEPNLKEKVLTKRVYVALCHMNQCTRGSGVPLVVGMDVSEGIVNQKAEEHKNLHRDHEKRSINLLNRIRAEQAEGKRE